MKRVGGRYGLFAIWLLLVAACPAFAEQAKLATTGDVYPFEGEFQYVYGINDRGDVVGEGLFQQTSFPQAILHEGYFWTNGGGLSYLGKLSGGGIEARANAVSANGSVVVGSAMHGVPRAVRRTVPGTMTPLETVGSDSFASSAEGVSGNGLVIVGYSEKWSGSPRAFRWTSAEGLVPLGSLAGGAGMSRAVSASNDGSVIIGETEVAGGATHAFRWTAAGDMIDLGTVAGAAGDSRAHGMSADGVFIVGESATESGATRAFLYTEGGSMVALPTLDDHPGNSYALTVSADGKTIAGASASDAFPDGEACIWFDGVPVSMRDMLANRYGLYDDDYAHFEDARCSGDGLKFAGNSTYDATWPGGGPAKAAYRVIIDPNLQPPVLETDVTEGSTLHVRVGETLRRTFRFSDPDVGGSIQINGWARPSSATLTPPIGTTSTTGPINAVFEWTPPNTSYGHLNECYISYSDKFGTMHRRSFKIQVAPNEPIAADPIEPEVVECENGVHTVKLSTTVHDPENASMLAKWFVDGEEMKVQDGVFSGTTLDFEHDYEHGVHEVEFHLWESNKWKMTPLIVSTTVTVQDTSAPIVIVTNDVTTSTDSGVDYATILDLPVPTASDASGHEIVSLENDGTGTYPLGETIVTWTATDEFGNVGTATQKVTVIDTEKPSIAGSASMKVFVDPGKVFSTAKPPLPYASDNVTDISQLKITSDAPARFPIGWTLVTFRATDDAGNFSEWPMSVGVANRKPRAKAGKNVSVTTTNERGLRVSLDGSASLDLDQQKLKFAWSAPGVKLAGAKSAKPSGLFPVGTTVVKLTVTDPVGASHSDTVSVIVRLKNGTPRPRGGDANRSFAAATQQAGKAVATKRSSGAAPGSTSAALAGLAYANAASAYGDAAGRFVQWNEGQSEADALLAYAELRAIQRTYGQAAANAFLSAYAETGDESLLSAYGYAAYGTAYAAADLTER